MSLFAGLFAGPGAAKSSIFAEQSVFRQPAEQQPEEAAAAPASKQKKPRKQKQAAGHEEAAAAPGPGSSKGAKGGSKRPRDHGAEAQQAAAGPSSSGRAQQRDKQQQQQHKKLKPTPGSSKGTQGAGGGKQALHGARHVAAAAATAHGGGSDSSSSGGTSSSSASGSDEDDAAGPSGQVEEAPTKKQLSPEEQAERLQRTVFVGNVPAKSTPKALKHFFARFGGVESARIRSVPVDLQSKLPRRAAIMKGKVDDERAPAVAYVVFKQAAHAEAALAANMTEMGGNHLRVDRAAPPAKNKASPAAAQQGPAGAHQFDATRSLFVGNLHFATLDEELIQFFTCPEALEGCPELSPDAHGGACALEGVRIVRDAQTSLGKGFGFVLFRTKAAVRAALSLNGRLLRKRALRLTRVSVQQQQRLQAARAARPAGKHTASRQGGPGRQGGGGAAANGGRGAGGAASWQGTAVKGKAKGVRGTKVQHGHAAKGGQAGGASKPGAPRSSGKRPAVAARKKKALSAKKKIAK